MLKNIEDKKHIVIKTTKQFLPEGSALYSYILTLHKKVSFVCEDENLAFRFSFLPWFDKIKKEVPLSADEVFVVDEELFLYDYFKNNGIKINKKMATALCSSYILKDEKDSLYFQSIAELIELGADYKVCEYNLLHKTSLSFLRLKGELLKNMLLVEDASVALLHVDDETLKSCGAILENAIDCMDEVLGLGYVKCVRLIKIDEENRVIAEKGNYFEK